MEYLHKFTSQADFDAKYNTFNYSEPWVSLTIQNNNGSVEKRVDYNKGFQGVDMVVDVAPVFNTYIYEASGCRIIYASKDIGISAEHEDPYDGRYTYTFSESSSIGPNGTKELLKVRILHFPDLESEPVDVEIPLNSRDSNSAYWLNQSVSLNSFNKSVHLSVSINSDYNSFEIA